MIFFNSITSITIKRIAIIVFHLLLTLLPGNILAQQAYCDTLKNELPKVKSLYERANIELQLAYLYEEVNADSLKHYASLVIKHAKQIKNDTLLCHGYLKYATLFSGFPKSRFLDSTWYYIDQAHNVAKKTPYIRGMASCFELKGNLKLNTTDKNGAITDLLEAKKLYVQSGDNESSYRVAFFIAQTYEIAGNYDKAFALYDSIGDIKALKNKDFYISFLEIVGTSYQKAKKFEKSLKYYQEAYSKLMVVGDNCEKHRILMKMASAYHFLGNSDSTKYYYDKTISYNDSCISNNRNGNDCVRLADICFDNKRFNEAEKYYLQSLDIVRGNGWNDSELYTLERISNFYKTQKNYAKALDYLQQYIHLKDNLKIEQLGQIINGALSDLQLATQKAELTKLYQVQGSMLKRNYIIIAYFIASALLFFSFWYIQAGLLFNFAKARLEQDGTKPVNSLWQYIPPRILQGNLNAVLVGLFYAVLNVGCYLLFFKTQHGVTASVYWAFIAWFMFFISDRLFSNRLISNSLSFKKELTLQQIILVLFMIVLTLVAIAINLIDVVFAEYFYFALLIAASLSITMGLIALIQYKKRFNILSEKLVDIYNKKLQERKNAHTVQNNSDAKEDCISIDNNGKPVEINLNNLLYIVSDNVYQEFISFEDEKTTKTLVRNTMGNIEKCLNDSNHFLRCHRSYIVNTSKIASIVRVSRQYYFVFEKSDDRIPISRITEDDILKEFSDLR
jgi:tetratricopeptide (TPR) repeat protein